MASQVTKSSSGSSGATGNTLSFKKSPQSPNTYLNKNGAAPTHSPIPPFPPQSPNKTMYNISQGKSMPISHNNNLDIQQVIQHPPQQQFWKSAQVQANEKARYKPEAKVQSKQYSFGPGEDAKTAADSSPIKKDALQVNQSYFAMLNPQHSAKYGFAEVGNINQYQNPGGQSSIFSSPVDPAMVLLQNQKQSKKFLNQGASVPPSSNNVQAATIAPQPQQIAVSRSLSQKTWQIMAKVNASNQFPTAKSPNAAIEIARKSFGKTRNITEQAPLELAIEQCKFTDLNNSSIQVRNPQFKLHQSPIQNQLVQYPSAVHPILAPVVQGSQSKTGNHKAMAVALAQRSSSKTQGSSKLVNYVVNNSLRSEEINKIISMQTQRIEQQLNSDDKSSRKSLHVIDEAPYQNNQFDPISELARLRVMEQQLQTVGSNKASLERLKRHLLNDIEASQSKQPGCYQSKRNIILHESQENWMSSSFNKELATSQRKLEAVDSNQLLTKSMSSAFPLPYQILDQKGGKQADQYLISTHGLNIAQIGATGGQSLSPSKKSFRLLQSDKSSDQLSLVQNLQKQTNSSLNSYKEQGSFTERKQLQKDINQASFEKLKQMLPSHILKMFNLSDPTTLPKVNNQQIGYSTNTSRREKLLSQDSTHPLPVRAAVTETDEHLVLPALSKQPHQNNTTQAINESIDFKRKKASVNQLAFDPQSSLIGGGGPYNNILPHANSQFIERLHKSNNKLYETNSGGKMPPYLAMKKMILEQQLRNSALYNMPLINTGGGGAEMHLKGEKLTNQVVPPPSKNPSLNQHPVIVNSSKTSDLGGALTERKPIAKLKQDERRGGLSPDQMMMVAPVMSTNKFVTVQAGLVVSSITQKRNGAGIHAPRQHSNVTPHFMLNDRYQEQKNLLHQDSESPQESKRTRGQLWQGNNNLSAYENCFKSQFSPQISRMMQQTNKNESVYLEESLLEQQSIAEESQRMPLQALIETKKLKTSPKKQASAVVSHQLMRTESIFPKQQFQQKQVVAAAPIIVYREADQGNCDLEKLQQKVNKCIQTVNEFLSLTLRNKNSLNQIQAKRLQKLAKALQIQPLLLQHTLLQFARPDELTRYMRTKEFLIIAKGHLSRAANQAIINTYTSETLETLKGPSWNTDIQGSTQTVKFYVDNTGNNNQLVKSILRRRSWLTVSNDPLFSAFDQVHIIWTQWKKARIVSSLKQHQLYNKIENNFLLTNKYYLLSTMRDFYDWRTSQTEQQSPLTADSPCASSSTLQKIRSYLEVMPETYRISVDPQKESNVNLNKGYQRFKAAYDDLKSQSGKSIWIVKPGENSNRGRGISIFDDLALIKDFIEGTARENEDEKTKFVIQKYISNPLLIEKRKFDFRVFGVASVIGGNIPNSEGSLTREFRGYFFKEGYIRTSSREYSISDLDNRYVHLTNDAIQKKSSDYGKFETGNKVCYEDFQEILRTTKDVDFYKDILPQIKQIVADTLEAFYHQLEQLASSQQIGQTANCFELFGYDFMMDDDCKLVLIEVNTNPCLETESCPLLTRLIPQVVDQTFKVAVDPLFDASEQEIGLSQEYPVSEIKMEMVVCKNFKIPIPPSPQQEIDLLDENLIANETEEQLVLAEGAPCRIICTPNS